MATHLLPIETPNPVFGEYLYPQAKVLKELQQKVPWTDMEIPIEDDVQDYLVKMDKHQLNLCQTTLQPFVEIEQSVGDIWETIGMWFPHSEIQGATSVIAAMEKGVHSFFYQKMSDVLNIDPKDTYRIQRELGPIRDKLVLIETIFKDPAKNKPLTLAALTMVEQMLLFGNFAMLKSFKANGNNLITNTLFGVDYVIADEALHGDFSAYLFKTYLSEAKLSDEKLKKLYTDIEHLRDIIVTHEASVITSVFKEVETINGVAAIDLISFVKQRGNIVMTNLSVSDHIPQLLVDNTKVESWFYNNINALKMHDFFAGGTTSYRKDWSEAKFSRLAYMEAKKNG